MEKHEQMNRPFDPSQFDWNLVYSGDLEDFEPPDPLVAEIASSLEPGRVLDVGCGCGGLLLALSQQGWTVTGLDLVPIAIDVARRVFEEAGLEADLFAADATTWQPPTQFDLVTNTFALPMLRADRAAVYAMIRQAIAPGGHVILKDFDPQMSRFSHFANIDMVSVDELTSAFAGYEIVRAEVVTTPAHVHAQEEHSDTAAWSASLLVARRPLT